MSKEHAYAYEAGYRDGSINYELEHCPACKNVADLQEALAENAKLRDLMYERAHVYAIQHMTEAELRIVATNVMEDNAKLRELIHDMLPFAEAGMDNTCVTRSCCMFDKCTSEAGDKCLIEEYIAARMRELGVIE